MKIINPATEELITEIQEDNRQSLEKKFHALAAAQPAWANQALKDRIAIINKFASLLEEKTESLSAILTSEVGKPLQQSRNEINGARARIKWLTENAEKYLSDETMSNGNGISIMPGRADGH